MKYPKMPGLNGLGEGPCVVFEKLDVTNLCASRSESGWKYSTRSGREITNRDDHFADFPQMVQEIEKELPFGEEYYFEYLGRNSFAGQHLIEPHYIYLIDYVRNGKIVDPFTFIDETNLKSIRTPTVVAKGRLPKNMITEIRTWRIEGAVIKGKGGWMCKVKSNKWLNRLAKAHKDGWWESDDGVRRYLKEEFDDNLKEEFDDNEVIT